MARELRVFFSAPSPASLQHKYTSIAEVQAQMEEEFLRSPLSGVSLPTAMESPTALILSGAWPTKLLQGLASS